MNSSNTTKTVMRLIVTAVNVLTAEPLIFDSFRKQIQFALIDKCFSQA